MKWIENITIFLVIWIVHFSVLTLAENQKPVKRGGGAFRFAVIWQTITKILCQK